LTEKEDGIAVRGLIIGHLILPDGRAGTEEVFSVIAGISPSIHVSLVGQYFPAHRAVSIPELHRKNTR